ncbi:hypothetical protein KQY30_35505 [Streptomyces sp. GMY02]|uniref:hypothetical protein n=1 Tax=Streptomyces sp. GMY02 TaxID=1333528 RepID=UPI001C2CC4B1|nr:hypothetical protein [Streptomyces sp. GMY02]QXE38730.1 hypothetical protein KQY30_35505 [Streptomyces sp. GMY02]
MGAPVTLAKGAAAVWGDELLTAGSTPGSVTGFNLTTKTASTAFTADAACVPRKLQAVGRWLYWSCGPGGGAGVYDRTAKKSVPVPSGEARLGDGYVVTHNKAAGELTLTTITGSDAVSRVIGELPDTGVSQRDVRWTVDESGTNAAYVDDQEQVHLVPSGVPAQPLRLLAPAANAASVQATKPTVTPGTLTSVLLSKPSEQWTLTVRNAAGKAVDTERGGAARGALSVGWHGNDRALPGTVFFPNGRYDWSLAITPADGQGSALTVTGTVDLIGGALGHAPKATAAPRITGTAKVGARLTAATGTWSPAATSYGYQWKADGTAAGRPHRAEWLVDHWQQRFSTGSGVSW